MRPTPPPADDLSSGPVHLDGAQPALEIPTPDGPATIWVRAPRATFGAEADPDFGRLENLLGVPRPWIGDLKNDPVSGLALSRAQRRREPRALPAIQEVPVQVRGLTVTTPGGRPLVEDVSFDVAPGAILAIAGPAQRPTGALVSALAGVAPFSGRISYGATHLTEDSAPLIRGALGIVPRDNLLTGPMPLRRALAHTVALRQPMAPRADRGAAVDEVAQGLGLIAHLDTPLVDLGPAAAKRAAIAMEVLARASVLILDEPTAGLDPEDEAELLRMLQALAQVGRRTIILTTHSAMAMSVADNVLLLDVTRAGSGRLAYHGPAAEAAHHFGADREWDFAQVYAELADPAADWSTQVRPALAPFDPDAGAAITALPAKLARAGPRRAAVGAATTGGVLVARRGLSRAARARHGTGHVGVVGIGLGQPRPDLCGCQYADPAPVARLYDAGHRPAAAGYGGARTSSGNGEPWSGT
jgi:ABC-type multidrug transport system ATPase subunit